MANTALYTGVSGLRAHQEMLNVVGNNLANINTTGFKSQRADFADLLYQTLRPAGSTSSASAGGTNPVQVGFGVQVEAIDQNFSQGSLQATGIDLDLALEGAGFFIVNNGQFFYTRAGAFSKDANNFLVDPATGAFVQRLGNIGEGTGGLPAFQVPGDNRIRLPFGTGIPAKATTTVTLQGNLSANAVGPLAQTLTSSQPFMSGGVPATGATLLNALSDNTTPYVAGDQIRLQGATVTGAAVNTTLAVGPGTTMGNLIAAINAAYPGSTATLDASGNIVLTANATGPAPALSLTISDVAGNVGATTWANHAMVATTVGKNGDTLNSAIQVYDTQGTAHTLSLTFQKVANNTWNLTGSIPAADGTLTSSLITGITFNANGSFQAVTGVPNTMTAQFTGIAAPQVINFSFGTPNGFNGLTQFGSPSSAAATSQDGFAAGFLSRVQIGKDGLINGIFTNGEILPIAQLAIALFANSGGLNREGNNYYTVSTNSGVPLVSVGQAGGRGSVQQGELETSNADTAFEFTQLIIAQRGFQINARTITSASEILQDLVNIIR